MDLNNIPKELQERDKWIITNKSNKPMHPSGFHEVTAFEPNHWISFSQAIDFLENKSEVYGVAYVFTDADPFAGIYLNKCLFDEKISKRANEVLQSLDSYTEYSHSPNGLNIIVKGRLKSESGYQITAPGEKRPWLEVYDRKQYFIVTGKVYKQHRTLEPRLEHLQRLEAELNNKPQTKPTPSEMYLFKHTMKTVLPDWSFTEKASGPVSYELVGNCPYKEKHSKKSKTSDFIAYITNAKNLYTRCHHTECLGEINKLNNELNLQWKHAKESDLSSSIISDISSASQVLDKSAPEKSYLVDGFLPKGMVGLLEAPAGTGKTFWLLSLACSVAAKHPFFDNRTHSGKVLMVFGEEDNDEIHRRLEAQLKQMNRSGSRKAVEENLDLLSTYSKNARFLEEQEENGKRIKLTPFYDQLLQSEYALIILDPLSRFYQGSETDSASATRFLELLEAITLKTGSTLLLSHHSPPINGSIDHNHPLHTVHSAIAVSLPWICRLSTLTPDAAEKAIKAGYQQVEGDNPAMWVQQTLQKANGLKPGTSDWFFRRGQHGILEKREPFDSSF